MFPSCNKRDSYLEHTSLGDNSTGFEEDEGMKLGGGTSGHLGIAMSQIHVACTALQRLAIPGALWQGGDSQGCCQQPMHEHISIPARAHITVSNRTQKRMHVTSGNKPLVVCILPDDGMYAAPEVSLLS